LKYNLQKDYFENLLYISNSNNNKMCDRYSVQPIRDLTIVARNHQFIRYIEPKNQINDNIFNEKCRDKTTTPYDYQMTSYKYQNNQRQEPSFSNVVDVSNNLMRQPKKSCLLL